MMDAALLKHSLHKLIWENCLALHTHPPLNIKSRQGITLSI